MGIKFTPATPEELVARGVQPAPEPKDEAKTDEAPAPEPKAAARKPKEAKK